MDKRNLFIIGLFALMLIGMYRCRSVTSVDQSAYSTEAELAFSKGMSWRAAGKRDRAIVHFRKAIRYDSTYAEAWFRLAEMFDKAGRPAEMMRALEQYVQLEANPPAAAYMKLGETAFELDQYGRAHSVLGEIDPNELSDRQRPKWRRLLRNSQFAQQAMRDTQDIQPKKMSPAINTNSYDEYWPVVLPDQSAFYFTRRVGDNEEFYVSRPGTDGWSPARPMTPLNTRRNEGAMAVSPNGNWMVFTWCNEPKGWGRCDLYITFFKDSTWTEPINLGPEINTGGWESGPSIGSNGQSLYYASTRSGGNGGSDIYRATWQKDNMWGEPENLGDNINTEEREQSPFLHPDGQTLYFRSNGWPGMGGFDLFVSRKKDDGTWAKPRNLGIPINTKEDEGSLFVGLDGKTAYYATDGFGSEEWLSSSVDIYTFELPEHARATPSTYVRLYALDAESLQPISVHIQMIDLETRDTIFSGEQHAGESQLFCVPAYHTYAVHVTAADYVFHSRHIALDTLQSAYDPIRDTILMQSVFSPSDSARPTVLQNVFFEYDKSRLLPESRVELDRLYRFLRNHSELNIIIRGHTDNIGSEKYNQRLSEERARAVYEYLVKSGIPPARLEYKGMGEEQPIADNETVEGRQTNRRTDFIINRDR